MLAYILALAVGVGSIAIYLMAFISPKSHRKNDFIWSGVGLFYALVLWIFARKITGGLLLGHVASVALLVWFGWQTITLRQQVPAPVEAAAQGNGTTSVTPKSSLPQPLAQLTSGLGGMFAGAKSRFQKTSTNSQPQDTKRAETSANKAVERLRTVKEESTPAESTQEESTTQETPVTDTTIVDKTTEPETAVTPEISSETPENNNPENHNPENGSDAIANSPNSPNPPNPNPGENEDNPPNSASAT